MILRAVRAALLAMAIATAGGANAQTDNDHAVAALRLMLETPHSVETLEQVQIELSAIISDFPFSSLGKALQTIPNGQQHSFMQLLQAKLPSQLRENDGSASPVGPLVCVRPELIATLADLIIAQRTEVPKLAQANYGTQAAYLWLHYAEPSLQEGVAFLNNLLTHGHRAPRQIEELFFAYASANMPLDQAMAISGITPQKALKRLQFNALAAMITYDDGATFFPILDAESTSGAFEERHSILPGIAGSLYYLEDSRKLAIAKVAETTGDLRIATLLLANLSDLSHYYDFAGRYADSPLISTFQPDYNGPNALVRNKPLHPVEGQRLDPMRQDYFNVFRAGLLIGEADFVNILLNQTGWEKEIEAAAITFLNRLERGETASIGRLEENWLLVYDDIASHIDPSLLVSAMSGFDINVRHYATRAQSVVDWLQAIRAIRPYLEGQTKAPPQRPEMLSSNFDWQTWTRLAGVVQRGKIPEGGSPEGQKMVVELLVTAGQLDKAIAFAQSNMEPKPRLTFYRDLMKRLDRACDAHSVSPGQAVLLGGLTAYRF